MKKSDIAKAMQLAGSKGGKRRASNLTSQERSEIARLGGLKKAERRRAAEAAGAPKETRRRKPRSAK